VVPTHPQRIRELGLGFVYVSFFLSMAKRNLLLQGSEIFVSSNPQIPPRKRKVKRFEMFPGP